MEKPDDIELEQLKKAYEEKTKDYKDVYNQLNETQNAETKNQLERQKKRLEEKLEEIYNEIEKLRPNSLVKILTANLDTDIAINSAIQTAYKSCCSRNSLQTKVESVKSIVEDLYNLDKRNLHSNEKFNHNDNTAKFIKSLITDSRIPQTTLEDLQKWGSNNIEDFDRLIQDVN
ncbi:MAG: hypothetical protein ACKPIB_02765, partial [Dolichospermum sp.]